MRRYPAWLKKQFSPDRTARIVRALVGELRLHTVCESAVCPNLRECYSRRQLTFMIAGNRCTRSCRFCAVEAGRPEPLDPEEPQRLAEAVRRLGLAHAVITSVARDDLRDEGAGHFVHVIDAVRAAAPGVTIEVLVPDFHGRRELIDQIVTAAPEVFAHNVETVERLSPVLRPQAEYRRSLQVLRMAREAVGAEGIVKSSVMVGLGERAEELRQTFEALVDAGCHHLTIGQYMRPTAWDLPVLEYVSPDRFTDYAAWAHEAGMAWVKAGPFVRSSYHAIDALNKECTSYELRVQGLECESSKLGTLNSQL